jgi:hypothetical protein
MANGYTVVKATIAFKPSVRVCPLLSEQLSLEYLHDKGYDNLTESLAGAHIHQSCVKRELLRLSNGLSEVDEPRSSCVIGYYAFRDRILKHRFRW